MSVIEPAPNAGSAEPSGPPPVSRAILSEDWLATIIGLAILLLVLVGVITKGMVP